MKRAPARLLAALLLVGAALVAGSAEPPAQTDPLARGLWWLYQLQYDKARDTFDLAITANPKDPAGYFFKTAVDWWELAQKADYYLPKTQNQLEKNYQDTVRVAKELYESTENPKLKAQACLYWGGADGLKGRWLVTQRQWVHAYFKGKSGAHLLRKALEYDPKLYDADMGLGIYDYFTDTLPGIEGVLSDLFIHGDRERGLQELQLAIDKGHYSQVEAKVFLLEIDTWEEHKPVQGLAIARQLYEEYPQSPMGHLAMIMDLYELGKWEEVGREAQVFLERSEKQTPYYTTDGIRPGLYCIGVAALQGDRNPQKCITYMDRILNGPIDTSRWISFAYLRRGQAYDVLGEREKAIADYNSVMARAPFWGSHRQAREGLKEPYKFPS